jgi:AcrR family transcriptional regulator
MTQPYHHGNLPTALRCAAAEVITEQGLGSFSLREVARRAGVSHTAPAHHFGDVTGLLTSLAREGFEKLYEAMSAATAEHAEPADRLVAIGQAYVAIGARYPAHCEVMFRADVVHQDDPQLQHAGVCAYGVLHETVTALCTAERLDVDVDDASKLCWAAMQGLLVLHPSMVHLDEMAGREPVSREALVVNFAQLVIDGLRAHPRARAKRRPPAGSRTGSPTPQPSGVSRRARR